MVADVQIPGSLNEARSVLTARALGLVPFQIRGQLLAVQGAESGADAAVPVAGDYFVGAVLDLPGADVPVNASMLATWGVGMESVLTAAHENRAQQEATVHEYGAALVIEGVPFASAALRNPAAVSQFRTGATPVIIVPEPGIVVVGFAEDDASLISAAVAAEQAIANTSRTVSITPLVSTGAGWAPFEWPAAVQAEAGKLRRRWDSIQYAAARSVLQQTYAAAGSDVFVAELALAESASGEWVTFASVSQMPMVVPRADFFVLTSDDGRSTRVTFAQLAALPGVLAAASGTVPEYFVVTRFPSELTAGA